MPKVRDQSNWADGFRPTSIPPALHASTTILGINACAWFPMAICSRPSKRARPRWSRMRSTPLPSTASSCAAARACADIIVTATGLSLVALGEVQLEVDGRAVDPSKILNYKGTMYGGIPNLASVFGYTNASWTLKSELTCNYICRVLNHMDRGGYQVCVPQNEDPSLTVEPWLNLSSGYIQRVADNCRSKAQEYRGSCTRTT